MSYPLIQFIPHPKWCMHTFGPKPHLLAKYYIGSAFIIQEYFIVHLLMDNKILLKL